MQVVALAVIRFLSLKYKENHLARNQKDKINFIFIQAISFPNPVITLRFS